MLRQRVITALVLAALLIGILSFDDRLPWLLFLLAAGAFAAEEWAALGGHTAPARAGYALLTTLAGAALFAPLPARLLATPLLLLACVFWCAVVPLLLWKGWRIPRGLPFLAVGWLLILSTLCALARLWTHGVALLVASMAVIWVSDITAYFSGRAWGRR
ncbi:MAG: phosphatidate cytidylyltransferase, partial [Burkholderiales bacterium]|nr:phosphatidate cytidylyltransferase [Burkholderiales bacterium]